MAISSSSAKSLSVVFFNLTLAIVLSWAMLSNLNHLKNEKQFANEKVEIVKEPVASSKATDPADSTATAAAPDSVERTIITPLPTELKAGKKGLVDFFDILLLMLIAGALGGVLSNLRGIFVYYRDEGGLPEDYTIPYLVRPFTAGVCGLFIYFVLSMIITSITLEPVVEGIGFQGAVSYIALAIVAGFGSQEFMERLKEVAITLFGVKKEKSTVQKLRDWKRLKDLGLITEAQFEKLRDDIIAVAPPTPSDEYESFRAPEKPSEKQGA